MNRIRVSAIGAALLAMSVWAQPAENASTPSPALAAAPAVADLTNQLRMAEERLHAVQSDNALLQAKLREALSSRPAAIDPQELAKADERIRALLKENELLRTALDKAQSGAQTKPGGAAESIEVERLKKTLAETNRRLQAQADAAVMLIAEANTKLQREKERADTLAFETETLRARLAQVGGGNAPAGSKELSRQLADAQARLAKAESEQERLRIDKAALELRLTQLTQAASQAQSASATPESARIKALERERDELQTKLAAANRELANRTSTAPLRKYESMNKQLLALRAKLDVYEAKAVPYTREELALFKKPEMKLVAAFSSSRRGGKKPSAANAALVAAGEREFAAGQKDAAAATFAHAASRDEKDVRIQCNLATVQASQGRFDEAEQSIQKALTLEPNDAASLGVLGFIRLNQERVDDALDALGRATKLKPKDPGIQNLLGVALVQKGMRGQAETAFRRALQLDSNFPDAHRNLASIYLTQEPPLTELARWHYQKAIAAGHPRVPEIEQRLGPGASANGSSNGK